MARRCEKWGFWLWIFAEGREIGGLYSSVIGHRLRVGAMGVKGKVQEGCRLCGLGWKCGKGAGHGGYFVFADAKVASRRHGRVLDYWDFRCVPPQ